MITAVAHKSQRHNRSTEVFGVKRMSRPAQASARTSAEPRRSFVAILLKALSAFAV